MKSLLSSKALLVVAALGLVAAADAQASQWYSEWTPYSGRPGVWRCSYQYHTPTHTATHYLIWYESDPGHCYCYDPRTQSYWGRWNYEFPNWSFSTAMFRYPGARPHEVPFQGAASSPAAPGTRLFMQPPEIFGPRTSDAEVRAETVEAESVNVHLVEFQPGALAYVRIDGDGDTDLDVHIFEPVYDSFGELTDLTLVASDEASGDVGQVVWTPRSGAYLVRISNLGGVYNAYALRANGRQIGATLR